MISLIKLKINIQKIKNWPKSPNQLSQKLNEIKTNLREKGVVIERYKDEKGTRKIKIRKVSSISPYRQKLENQAHNLDNFFDDTLGDTKKVSSNENEKDQEKNNGFGRFDDIDDILHNDKRHDKLKKEETRILYCPYCDWFRTSQEKYYTNHVMNKHPGKLLYPNRILLESMSLKPKGNPWEN